MTNSHKISEESLRMIRMQYWDWNKKTKVVMYGVNQYSQKLTDTLRNNGFQILAYIDKRAKELKMINGIDVYEIDAVSIEKGGDICVIVMLQNAMQHDEIAKQLFDRGITKLVFIPMLLSYEKKYAGELCKVYNNILQGDFENVKIPYYNMLIQNSDLRSEETFYDQNNNYLTVPISADIIYTHPKEMAPYADVPLTAFKPYNQMFMYFLADKNGDIKEYLREYGVNSCNYTNAFTDEKIILQREELYEIWNEHFQEGLAFFISSAPLAKWNDKGYFNLMEGQHRTLFLIKKGIYYLPVQISRDDYEKWKNGNVLERIKSDVCLLNAKFPIHNPSFQRESFYNKISIIESMLQIQQNLAWDTYKGKEILSIDTVCGYYGFHLRRMGGQDVTLVAKDDSERCIMNNMLDLYGLQCINILIDLQKESLKHFSFISIIGNNDKFNAYKQDIINNFDTWSTEAILISLAQKELEIVNESITKRLVPISKVFLNTEMTQIYLLIKDL